MTLSWGRPTIDRCREPTVAWLARHPVLRGAAIMVLTACGIALSQTVFDRIVPTIDNGWAIYWPFNGIVAALLLMCRRSYWPWIMAGFALAIAGAEIHGHDPVDEIAIVILSNGVEVLIAVLLLPPFRSLKQWLLEPYLFSRFGVYGILLGPFLTAFPVGYYFAHRTPGYFWDTVLRWGLSDALGAALWTPLVLVLFSRETYKLFRWRALPETLALLLGLCAVTWATFSQDQYPLSYLPYPLLLFVALRLGFSGAVIGFNLLTAIVASRTMHGAGLFHPATGVWDTRHIVLFEVFSILAVLLVFPLTVALVGRKDFEDRLRKALAGMKQLATVDTLTGVANRGHFDTVLAREWRRAVRNSTPVGLMMIDADCFKAFNDRYGHVAGDECLRKIAAILLAFPLRRDDIVARYGGEEFAVLLPGPNWGHLEASAEQLRADVAAAAIPHEGNPHGIVTISVGFALMPARLDGVPEDLIEAADRALYQAKQAGRNRVCCHEGTAA